MKKEILGIVPSDLPAKASGYKEQFKNSILRTKGTKNRDLDTFVNDQHNELFRSIDCLECGNCCKTTPALLQNTDIDRIADRLKLSKGTFMEQYVIMDEDGDFVFNSSPCPMLGADNYCSIYEDRPAACRDYPHMTRKKQRQLMDIHLENTRICPAVFHMMLRLESHLLP